MSTEDPEAQDWWPFGELEGFESLAQACLSIHPDTRVCRVAMEGSAAGLLGFLDPEEEDGLVARLGMEAAFDGIVVAFQEREDGPVDQ